METSLPKIDLMGLEITAAPKSAILAALSERVRQRRKTFVVTPYSEFFYYAAKDYRFRGAVNAADFSLPDGISLQLLAYYFSKPLTVSGYYAKIIQAAAQEVVALFTTLLNKKKLTQVIPERISGADFFWDVARLCDQQGFSMFLLGGFGDTGALAAEQIRNKYPNVRIGHSPANPNDQEGIEAINAAKPDFVLVAYGPVRQELWIQEHLPHIHAIAAIGVGGTLDYAAGKKPRAPKAIRRMGLEWLYRLLTQPKRIRRMWHATFSMLLAALRHKVFSTLGYRPNAAGIVINEKKQVLVFRRSRRKFSHNSNAGQHWQFSQGGIEPGENPEQGALREMKEELGTDKFAVLGTARETYRYDWNHYFRPLFWRNWKMKGQEQYIVFLKFTGVDSDLRLDTREIDQFKWVDPGELPEIIHPMRSEMLQVMLSSLPDFLAKI